MRGDGRRAFVLTWDPFDAGNGQGTGNSGYLGGRRRRPRAMDVRAAASATVPQLSDVPFRQHVQRSSAMCAALAGRVVERARHVDHRDGSRHRLTHVPRCSLRALQCKNPQTGTLARCIPRRRLPVRTCMGQRIDLALPYRLPDPPGLRRIRAGRYMRGRSRRLFAAPRRIPAIRSAGDGTVYRAGPVVRPG